MSRRPLYVPATLDVIEVIVRDEVLALGSPKPEGDIVDSHGGVWWHRPNRPVPDSDVWQVGTKTLNTFLTPRDNLGNVGTVIGDVRGTLEVLQVDPPSIRHSISGYGWATVLEHVFEDCPATIAFWTEDARPTVSDVWRTPLVNGNLGPLDVHPFDSAIKTAQIGSTIDIGSMDNVGAWIYLTRLVEIGGTLYHIRRNSTTVFEEAA